MTFLIQVLTWAVPVRSAAGARQTFQVNVMRKEGYRKSAEALQNELSLLPWMLLLGRKGRGEEGERQREEKTRRFESCGWGEGTQPQSWMKQKGNHEEKHRLKNE